MPAALRIDNLSKRYVVSHEARRDKYRTLRESLTEMLTLPIRRMRGQGPVKYEEFWALNDISFEVQQGEVVGIIGRNGAGKSTLLKILSRITKPTRGRVELNGRVGSLLEVGTGFHPELTGRENIYLNGSILGMSKREIERKFDEIVAFAEIEQFLDTPVKRYSSGMYVRLAFAVAAHLEPEILIVDEVLAVGDTAFQKKCLGKMREVGKTGCTVLFVSHNLAAVKTLCSSGVVLGNGRVMRRDDIAGCLNTYAEMTEPHAKRGAWIRDPALPLKPLNIMGLNCRLEGRQPELLLSAEISLLSTTRHSPAMLALELADSSGTVILQALPRVQGFIKQSAGEAVECSHSVSLEVALPPLIPGEYSISIWTGMHNTHTFEYLEHICWLSIADSPCVERTFPHSSDHGWICPPTKLAYTGPQTVT